MTPIPAATGLVSQAPIVGDLDSALTYPHFTCAMSIYGITVHS